MTEHEYVLRAEGLKVRLYQTALLYLGSEADALEAVDQAVYKGLLGHKRLREPAFFDTWMTRILINACHDELRRKKRVQPMEALPETAAEPYDALPLREAVGKLPLKLREPLVLRYFSGYRLEEIAEILGIPRGTVSTRLRKALDLLRLELKEEA